MATHDYVIANGSGAAVRADINGVLSAIVSNNSSATEPTTTYAYMWWADTTAGQLKIRNSTDTDWVVINELDGTSLMEDGTVSAPGLAFADDLNTGFYRPGADQLAIATNGIERVEFGTTEVVFNDGGEDIDFRVEGDTNANLFFVDAGNDRVGIGTASPDVNLTIKDVSAGGTGGALRLLNATTTIGSKASLLFTTTTNETYESARIDAERASTGTHLVFSSNAIERARIDNSGRFLVGPTSSLNSACVFQTHGDSIRDWAIKYTGTSGNAETGIKWLDKNNFANAQISNSLQNDGLGAQAAHLVFKTANGGSLTERMRIKGSASTEINVSGTNSSDTGSFIFVNSSQTRYWSISTNSTNFFVADDNFSNYAYLSQNPTSWQFASDARLKENIADISYGIETIKQLQPRQFNFISNPAETVLGFVAQELRPVVPEAVSGIEQEYSDDDTPQERAQKSLGVAKDTLIPVLVKALQEAVERIEELEAKVAALESA